MDSEPSLSPAVAGRDIAIGVSGKSSPDGAVVGVESLLEDPSVPVAAAEDKITVSTAVAGRSNGEPHRPNPWLNHDDPTAEINSSSLSWSDPDPDSPVDAYSGDHFRMFQFKVRPCARVRSLDWTECPYAHPGENARRRDPRKFHYSDSACPGSGPSGCGLHVGVGAGISSDGSNGHSSTDSAVIESDYPDLQPQYTNLMPQIGNLETINFESFAFQSPVYPVNLETIFLRRFAMFETGNLEEGNSMGVTLVVPPVYERGLTPRMLDAIGFTSVPNSMGGTPVLPPAYVVGEGGLLLPGFDYASLPISMGGTVIRTGNVEGGLVRRMLAGIVLASPSSVGDTFVIQTGDVETGHLLTGSRFGVGGSDITPMNDDFRLYIVNSEPQTGNYPPPLEMSGDNSHLVRLLEQHLRSNGFVILFVISEILGIVFEIIYEESHIMPYFVIWIVCVTIVMYAARRLAMTEGGMANREQFAVYLRCFSFLLLELLQYWGIHQGNYVTALKIILRVTGAIIGWWVVGVLQSYMDAFGMHLPLRRRED